MSLLDFRKNDAGDAPEREEYARIIDLDINVIEVSHMNPRQTRGEHYDSTKESIRNIGLLQMLTVTKVPGQEHYSLYNGGNTRLSILKELYQEYLAAGEGDKAEAIRMQQCRYVPYTDDIDVLVRHMAENEERSDMTFADKARAVFQIRELYLKQSGEENVSNNKLVKFIHSLGWTSINQPMMTELNFVLEELEKFIPQALDAGMGKGKIQQIRRWWGYVETYLQWLIDNDKVSRRADGTEQPYTIGQARQLYFATLAERDSDEMPIDIDEFLEDFRCRWALELQQYNPTTNSVRILTELESIEEHGYVLEEVPMEELRQRLEETATVPISRWPTPRKPRTPRDPADSSANAPAENSHENDGGSFDSDNGAGYAGGNGGELFPDNPGSTPPTSPSGGADMAARKAAVPASLTPPKEREVQPVPYGPIFKYPDLRQSMEKLHAELRRRCTENVEYLLEFFDANGLLRRLVRTEYQGNDPQSDDAQIFNDAPYFYLALDSDDIMREVHNRLLEAGEAERFVTLYFIRTWAFYVRHAFLEPEPGSADLANQQRTDLLWKEFGDIYNDTLFLCRSGLVFSQRTLEEAENLRLADDIMLEHGGLIYTRGLAGAMRRANAKKAEDGHVGGA